MPATAKPKRRRLQFSLGALLLAVAALSVWLAAVSREARLQKQAVGRILELGGDVNYDYQVRADGHYALGGEPNAPKWLRQLVGDDYFENVVYVKCKEVNEADLELIASLPRLRELNFSLPSSPARKLELLRRAKNLRSLTVSGPFGDDALRTLANIIQLRSLTVLACRGTDNGFASLAQLEDIESLRISSTRISDAGFVDLKLLSNLKSLRLARTIVGDGVLAGLHDMALLERLDLSGTKITDAGLRNLEHLNHLLRLDVSNTAITDAAVPALAKLASLERLDIFRTKISNAGIRQLQRALPKTFIGGAKP